MFTELENMTIRDLMEYSAENRLRIEIEIEMDENGQPRRRITVEPWAPYAPACPYAQKETNAVG